jgi:hypothetical protein
MPDIAGIPYSEVVFDKHGNREASLSVPATTTDLFIVSHGWNNDNDQARELYRALFTNIADQLAMFDLHGRKLAIAGVLWPSKQFNFKVAAIGGTAKGPAAGISPVHGGEGLAAVIQKLETLKEIFDSPAAQQKLEEAKSIAPDLHQASARRRFVAMIRSLLDPANADAEDASTAFFSSKDDDLLMKRLQIDEDDLAEDIKKPGGATRMQSDKKSTGTPVGAAGCVDFFSGIPAPAINLLNYAAYYEMKTRAGTVGKKGVAPLTDELGATVPQIHMIGHSFGGRLVTAASANSRTDKIKSMALLQAAFSHNGFSKIRHGFFRRVADNPKRVDGAILITYTRNDMAVGLAYPLASRISGDARAGFGDPTDKFGGIGRNGAQQMEPGEVDSKECALREVGGRYEFSRGHFFNLNADQFIKHHGDVTGKQIAYAILSAVAKKK